MSRLVVFCGMLILAIVTLMARISYAAEMSVKCETESEMKGGCSIILKGEIQPGDSEKLRGVLAMAPSSSDIFRTLVLNSPGGDVYEAFKLAEIVRLNLLETGNARQLSATLQEGFVCASACFLVLVSGAKRIIYTAGNGKVGLHRPYLSPSHYENADTRTVAAKQQEAMIKVRQYLTAEGIPQKLIDEMMNRSSKEVFWITHFGITSNIPTIAAWYEELLIAKCDYDPEIYSKMDQAILKKDMRLHDRYWEKMIRSASCSRQLISEAQARFRKFGR